MSPSTGFDSNIGAFMKSLKSLLTLSALALAVSGSALATNNPLTVVKDNAMSEAKTTLQSNVDSTKDSVAAKSKELKESAVADKNALTKKVDSVKEKVQSVKENAKATDGASVKETMQKKADDAKAKAKEKVNDTQEKIKKSAKVNVNNADAATLQKLSGIGEKKAQAIIDYRNKVGKIKNVAELSKIDGLGETTIEKITPYLTF